MRQKMRHFFSFARLFSILKPVAKNSGGGGLSLSIKALATLALAQSVAFADFVFVSTADKDWLPTNDKKAIASGNSVTLPYGKNKSKNFIMDVGGDSPLGYGNGQQYTITINIQDDGSEKVDEKGYYELIVDMNLAKSVLVSEAQYDGEISQHIKDKKVTPPSVYGQFENKGINFILESKNNAKSINYGKCEIKNSNDSTLKQFKIIIPKNAPTHQLVIKTDDKMIDCAKSATANNDTKSYFYGIRMSIKHENKAFVGVDSTGSMIGTNYQASDGKSTYNLPTLIIGREDTLPSYCTQAMINNGSYACKKETNGTGVDKSGDKKALLWAACGESDILDEMDCRKPGANCVNREGSASRQIQQKAWLHTNNEDSRLTDQVGGNGYLNFYFRNEDGKTLRNGNDYCGDPSESCTNFQGFCWRDYIYESTIYSSGFSFRREQGIGNTRTALCDASNEYWYAYEVKAPKLFTISLRDYANRTDLRNRNESDLNKIKNTSYKPQEAADLMFKEYGYNRDDYKNLPHFEAKFRIVQASTEKRHYVVDKKGSQSCGDTADCIRCTKLGQNNRYWADRGFATTTNMHSELRTPKKTYFKDKIKCWLLKDDGSRTANTISERNCEKKLGQVCVAIEGTENEPTFTIKSKDFSSDLRGVRIQCQLDLSDYEDTKNFNTAGLYQAFSYNIQLASLKVLNTANAKYSDLALSTRCDFATQWSSMPGRSIAQSFGPAYVHDDICTATRVRENQDGSKDIKNTITYKSRQAECVKYHEANGVTSNDCEKDKAPNLRSKTRHFRFEARPLFYVAKELPNLDQNELYAGYKYHESTNLNQNASNLKFLYDKKENEKLIDTAIKFPQNYTGNKVEKIQIIGARDAENQPIIMNTFDGVKLKGTMASIYARDSELETQNHKDSKINNIFYTSSTNLMSGSTTIGSSWIKNCFTNNICRSVWGDLVKDRVDLSGVTADGNAKQSTFSAFIYTDLYEGNKYLTYDNAGKTMLALRDSDFTGFSQTNKTTHSFHPEPLCEVGEVRAIYLTPLNDKTKTGEGDYTKFRTDGKDKGSKDENNAVYGCDIPVVTNPELRNFAEYKTFKFYTFNPAMIKINSAAAGKAIGTSLYHSQKFIYNRGKCSNYPTYPEIACRDDIENPAFKIQVGAVGLTRADIEANNFLTRYDGTAVSSDDVSIRGSVLEPLIVHQGRNKTKNMTEEFNFKLKNKDLENLYLAPRCVSEFSIRQGGMVLNCKSGDKVDENNYIAKANNSKLVDIANAEVNLYGKMHKEQTHWQNLVSKKGEADITIYKTGFINGVAELDNVKREDKKEPDSQGLIFGKGGQSNYSLLKPSDPIIPENMLEEVEVPVDNQINTWIEKPKGMSVMSDSFGAATVLDVTLIAPNKQVGINKDNAVFLAAYISKPELVKKLQNKAIIGEIIPGYANYYRIRRDAFGNNFADKFFNYSNVEFIEPVKDNKNDGDFLRIADIDNEATATLIPSADGDKSYILYCNFIRNCYPLGDGTYGAKFRGFANKETNWSKDNDQGSTILDKARTRPTQKRIAW